MGLLSKVTAENESLLPEELRTEMGVGPGDRLEWYRRRDGSLVVRRVAEGGHIVEEATPTQGRSEDDSFESIRGIVKVDPKYWVADVTEAVDRARAAMGRPDVERP